MALDTGSRIPSINIIEEELFKKARDFNFSMRGIRKSDTKDIFERKLYIFPGDLIVTNYSRKHPVAAFNPGAVLENETLYVFPRLLFEYYMNISSIGVFLLNIEDVLNNRMKKPIDVRIIIWPRELWNFRGCEDPRVTIKGDHYYMLFTGYGFFLRNDKLTDAIVQAYTVLNRDFREVSRRKFFRIVSSGGEEIIPFTKDSAFIDIGDRKSRVLTRPSIRNIDIGWSGIIDLENGHVELDSLRPSLWFEPWEFKVGWSTNIVKLSSNELLIGWHGVLKEDYSYRNGLAIVSPEGEVLAITNYILAPHGILEEYGDRPLVIFGNGLVHYKEFLMWIGGISDYAIGLFITEINKALETMKWIKG